MMLYARSCERPSKSSARVFFPSSVSNTYSFSTGTHGSWRRCSAAFRPSSACSASSFASSSRAACHSSRVPILWSAIVVPPLALVTSAYAYVETGASRTTHRPASPLTAGARRYARAEQRLIAADRERDRQAEADLPERRLRLLEARPGEATRGSAD